MSDSTRKTLTRRQHMPAFAANAKQRGVVLATALLFLLILTILGVTAMANANIELLLGSNYDTQLKTFVEAENALAAAEQKLPAKPPKKDKPGDAMYLSPQPVSDPAFWNADNTRSIDLGTAQTGATQTRYIFRYLGTGVIRQSGASASTTQSYASTSGDQLIQLYQVTIRGSGRRNSVRTIQSIYGTP